MRLRAARRLEGDRQIGTVISRRAEEHRECETGFIVGRPTRHTARAGDRQNRPPSPDRPAGISDTPIVSSIAEPKLSAPAEIVV